MTFSFPSIPGISEEQLAIHVALYEGYVKHVNVIRSKIKELTDADPEGNAYVVSELRRRFAFEFDGVRMHELFFEQLAGGAKALHDGSLITLANETYGSWDALIKHIVGVAISRGIGWAVVAFDPVQNTLHPVLVGYHEVGQLAGLPILFVLDMWEHAFMVDYRPATKKNYVNAILAATDWSVVESRLKKVSA